MRTRTRYLILLFIFILTSLSYAESIEFRDAALLDVVQILARQAGLNVVIAGDQSLGLTKKVSLKLNNASPQTALEQVLKLNGVIAEKNGSTLLISLLPEDQGYRGETKVINLKNLSAKKVGELLAKLMPLLKNSQGGRANALVLQGSGSLIQEAEKLVVRIDQPIPQIMIESKVIEISQSDSMRLGLAYGSESGTFKISPAEELPATLNSLISEGRAKVVATPKIATLDNHEAIINIGSRIPYAVPVSSGSSTTQWTVEYIDAGVKLKITPQLGQDGQITTFIQPEVSSVSEWKTTAAGDFPVITTRNAQATLRVQDGETIVVGGLFSESDRENVSKLPVLGYIPVLGFLFQNKTSEKAKTEIVFLITPYII